MSSTSRKDSITSTSPIDGRYSDKIDPKLMELNSEFGLIKKRVQVEISWFKKLMTIQPIKRKYRLSKGDLDFVEKISKNFSINDAHEVKNIEKTCNHDVKSIEYFIKKRFLERDNLKKSSEMIHFCATSEDINNLAYALISTDSLKIIKKELKNIIYTLSTIAKKHSDLAMISRTHGQKASPTTFGKEIKVYEYRLKNQLNKLNKIQIKGKMNGAVGNFNAHYAVLNNIDWPKISENYVKSLGLYNNPLTTQIESHDWIYEMLSIINHLALILENLCRDMWTYIMLDYIKQKKNEDEVGSSTMPHKVNPIDFENAEGNLSIVYGLSNAISKKLLTSRLQRDLSDSTTLRNLGTVYCQFFLATQSLAKGFSKIDLNENVITKDLENSWELLAEPIQSVMRYNSIPNSYEVLKKFTRGKSINKRNLRKMIKDLKLNKGLEKKLLNIKPSSYIGVAKKLSNKKI